jgi:serine/threonine-protein phosphatase 2A regulatory subunit B
VDIKPANMEELTEVITAAEFHPQQCNLLMYSSSKGTAKLADMRESALCDQNAKGVCIYLFGIMIISSA